MAQVSESKTSLRVIGDPLDPDEITKLLGGSPTSAQKNGDIIIGQTTGNRREAKFRMWRIIASKQSPENLDGQVEEILSQLTDDISVWKNLGSRFRLNLFCGLFMKDSNEGMDISSETLMALGQRGITIGLDIYAPTIEDSE